MTSHAHLARVNVTNLISTIVFSINDMPTNFTSTPILLEKMISKNLKSTSEMLNIDEIFRRMNIYTSRFTRAYKIIKITHALK